MLAGRREFQRQFADAPVQSDVQWLAWHGDPEKRLRPLGEILPRCPKPLAALVQRMASKNAAERPASLDQIAGTLLDLHMSTERTVSMPAVSSPDKGAQQGAPGEKAEDKLHSTFRKALRAMRAGGPILVVVLAAVAILAVAWLAATRLNVILPRRDKSEPAGRQTSSGTVPAQRPARPAYPKTIATATGEMALVPEGEFIMGTNRGAPNEAPGHTVSTPPYYIDKYEVRHPPRSGWLDELGRLKGGWPRV